MYWACKQRLTRIFAVALLLLAMQPGHAQNVTAPYSILGIGDIDTKDYGRYFSSGSASLARRSEYGYNYANPASLTALPFKTMHFDVALVGRSATYLTPWSDTATLPNKDMVVKRVTMAFKVNNKAAFAFGLRPYSSVNYSFSQQVSILDGNTTYQKFIDGSGCINYPMTCQSVKLFGPREGQKIKLGSLL